jgi:hypothetical protein
MIRKGGVDVRFSSNGAKMKLLIRQRYAQQLLQPLLATSFVFLALCSTTWAFTTTAGARQSAIFPRSVSSRQCIFQNNMVVDPHSFWTAVEVFDGSSIVDPVVVSDAFWASLKGKILAVVIGQFLATIVFGIVASFIAAQLSNIGQAVSKTVSSAIGTQPKGSSGGRREDSIVRKERSKSPDFGKLLLCLFIDFAGSSSEVIPLLGDLTDVVFAPVAATALRSLFGGSNVIFGLEFLEEILPLTDILPLATIW